MAGLLSDPVWSNALHSTSSSPLPPTSGSFTSYGLEEPGRGRRSQTQPAGKGLCKKQREDTTIAVAVLAPVDRKLQQEVLSELSAQVISLP